MERQMSIESRRELLRSIGERYRAGSREAKRFILDEFVAVTGYHRKHAIRMLRATKAALPGAQRPRRRQYDDAVGEALLLLWEASDRICGKRLRPLIPTLVEALERHGHMQVGGDVRMRLLSLSAATIDRLLTVRRSKGRDRARRPSRVMSAIRRSVPVRTFGDWKQPPPGFVEADLVSHSGGHAAGSFAQTLTITDIASGWTECVALVVRDGALVVEALTKLRKTLPFPFRGFDTDNGSEFLNRGLLRYCRRHSSHVTHGRQYRKNDQAGVELRNWLAVRRLVGRDSYRSHVAFGLLKRYDLLRV